MDWELLTASLREALGAVITAVSVLVATGVLTGLLARFLTKVERAARTSTWFAPEWACALRRIATVLIWMLGMATACLLLPWADNGTFQGMTLVLGLALVLGARGVIYQWICGIVILYSRILRVGDSVVIAGHDGVVAEMGAFAVKVHTVSREEVTVPNALFLRAIG